MVLVALHGRDALRMISVLIAVVRFALFFLVTWRFSVTCMPRESTGFCSASRGWTGYYLWPLPATTIAVPPNNRSAPEHRKAEMCTKNTLVAQKSGNTRIIHWCQRSMEIKHRVLLTRPAIDGFTLQPCIPADCMYWCVYILLVCLVNTRPVGDVD